MYWKTTTATIHFCFTLTVLMLENPFSLTPIWRCCSRTNTCFLRFSWSQIVLIVTTQNSEMFHGFCMSRNVLNECFTLANMIPAELFVFSAVRVSILGVKCGRALKHYEKQIHWKCIVSGQKSRWIPEFGSVDARMRRFGFSSENFLGTCHFLSFFCLVLLNNWWEGWKHDVLTVPL